MPVILLYHPHILLFFPAHHLLDLYLQKEEVDSLAGLLHHLAHFSSEYLFNHEIRLLCLRIVNCYLFYMSFYSNFDSNWSADFSLDQSFQKIE
jgi:hypothetical protein